MNHKQPTPPTPWKLFILLGVLTFCFITGGYRYYQYETTAVRAEKFNEMKAIADLKIRQITSWRQDREADASTYSTGMVQANTLQWLKTPEISSGIQTTLQKRFQAIRKHKGYDNIILAGTDGRILLSLNSGLTDLASNTKQLVDRAISSQNVVFGDFFRCPNDNRIYLDVAAPIFGEDNLPAAALILRSDPAQQVYPLIQSWPVPSKTAETLLVRKDGDDVLFLNTLRHRPDKPQTFRIPIAKTEVPAVRAALGQTGLFEGRDYRDMEVLADIRSVPNSPWFMMTKADTDEILSIARYRGSLIGLITLTLTFLAWTSMGFFYKHQGKRAFQELFQTEHNLREAEKEYKTTLYSIGDAVITTDMNGRIRQMNPVAERLTGWTESQVKGKPTEDVFRIISEETGETVKNPVQKVLENGKIIGLANHALLVSKDGTQIPITDSGAPIRDENGDVTGVVLVFRDQTRERDLSRLLSARLELLMESESRFRLLFENLPVAYQSLDAQGNFLDINKTWLAELGYTKEEVIGKWFGDFLAGDGPGLFQQGFETFKAANEIHGIEYEMRRKDGSPITVFFEGRISRDINNAFDRTHCVFVNITHQKNMESQLRQAQKMESVGRLAGGVAHDFNNMLMVIIGYTEIVLGQVDPGLPIFKDLQEILNAARRSANLTRQLLAFARKQTINPVVLDLNDTISSMLKLLRKLIGEDIDLAWKPGADIWPVKMDPAQIDQILANLLINAKDAIGGVGAVTIETENVEFDEDYCAHHVGFVLGKYTLIAVSDTGAGMDKETRDRIFEPFFTTKGLGKGTGLGLATVFGIVKQNNGFINVYSEPGQGTTFKIYLPRTESGVVEEAIAVSSKNLMGNETVLLVEDEESILNLGTTILTQYGYTVLSAKSPSDALIMAKHSGEPIHLLVTDVVMPEMNGKELMERISAVRPGIKCLFMSGYTANAIAHHGVLDSGVHFLQKPFSVRHLAEKIREVLDEG